MDIEDYIPLRYQRGSEYEWNLSRAGSVIAVWATQDDVAVVVGSIHISPGVPIVGYIPGITENGVLVRDRNEYDTAWAAVLAVQDADGLDPCFEHGDQRDYQAVSQNIALFNCTEAQADLFQGIMQAADMGQG